MTGKLDFVLQFRDEQVAEEVRRKAELGWLDTEFMVYGTAYLKNDQMYYRISSEEKDIYAFIEASLAEHIFCGDVLSLYKRCSVPIGTKEDKEIELAKQLGQQLKKNTPENYLSFCRNYLKRCKVMKAMTGCCKCRKRWKGFLRKRGWGGLKASWRPAMAVKDYLTSIILSSSSG